MAEDNEDNFLVIRSNLKKKPEYELMWAKNGKEVFEILDGGYDPDIFLLDIEMPIMDGNEVIRLLRGDKRYSHKPIVVVTASVFADMKSSYKAVGADDILEKPFSRSELLGVISKHAKN